MPRTAKKGLEKLEDTLQKANQWKTMETEKLTKAFVQKYAAFAISSDYWGRSCKHLVDFEIFTRRQFQAVGKNMITCRRYTATNYVGIF